jgi:5-hydroxyisourate hydrolase-like protein (transthyretin family)
MANKGQLAGGVFDTLLMLRTSGDGSLTTTGTCSGVSIYGTPASGATAKVVVPAAASTTTLIVEIQVADTDADTSYATVAQSEVITAAGEYDIRFATRRRYVRSKHSVAGTSPDFGAVQIGITSGGFG